jgi:hypothetical protein
MLPIACRIAALASVPTKATANPRIGASASMLAAMQRLIGQPRLVAATKIANTIVAAAAVAFIACSAAMAEDKCADQVSAATQRSTSSAAVAMKTIAMTAATARTAFGVRRRIDAPNAWTKRTHDRQR